MRVMLWVADLARDFWAEVGTAEPFPRTLRDAIAWTLPLTVVTLPRLRLEDLRAWLRGNGVAAAFDCDDRGLRACLAARGAHGAIFIDGTDGEAEQRFSLAHELGHFLRHHWQPRHLACRRLGAQFIDVLDGRRPPTSSERVGALLKGVPLGVELHLMRRGLRRTMEAAVAQAEEEADRLAYELLAPAAEVAARAGGDLVALLDAQFGLPAAQACDYAAMLMPPEFEEPLLRRLR